MFMKRIFFSLCFAALLTTGFAQETTTNYKEKQNYKDWSKIAPKFEDDFFQTDEAKRIGDNVLLYQQTTGGWPKNIFMAAELNEAEYQEALARKNKVNESTIDNNATTTEMEYLARLFLATGEEKYKEAVVKGLNYLIESQYDNGGFPQFYPRPKGYYTQITYNDNAMTRVMEVLQEVYSGKGPYTFLAEADKDRAKASFDKGVECILATQVRQKGKLTVWCAQHDKETLEPCKARAYELPSLSGQESDNIVILLMTIPNPSEQVINAIESAVEWFKENQIDGLAKEYFTNEEGKKDYRMVASDDCPPLWARFCELDDNRPFFSDRDGVKKYDLAEIGYERRNGYSWYNSDGLKVFKKYAQWKKKNKR